METGRVRRNDLSLGYTKWNLKQGKAHQQFRLFQEPKRSVKRQLTKRGPKLFRMLLNDELAPLIKGFGKSLAKFGENLQFRLESERSRPVQRRCLF